VITAAVLPTWPYSRRWGYAPAVGIAATAVIFAGLLWADVI
jgi:hypothetical protein